MPSAAKDCFVPKVASNKFSTGSPLVTGQISSTAR